VRLRRQNEAIVVALGVLVMVTPALAGLSGDVDVDCDVDIADAVLLERSLAGFVTLTDEQTDSADLVPIGSWVKDGVVDVGDLVTLKRVVARDANPAAPLSPRPTLGAIPATWTQSVPITVSGYAPIGSVVYLYVNGSRHPYQDTADAVTGDFEFSDTSGSGRLPLVDGENRITVVATNGNSASCSSLSQTVTYAPQVQDPNITTDLAETIVWTPGLTGGQPLVINTTIHVEGNAALFIQPGTNVHFGTNGKLVVDAGGGLQVLGDPGNEPVLKAAPPSACTNSDRWGGIEIKSNPVPENRIEHARIDCTDNGLAIGVGGRATLRESELKRWGPSFSAVAIASNALGATIESNLLVGSGLYGVNSALLGSVINHNTIESLGTGLYLAARPGSVRGNHISRARAGIAIVNGDTTPFTIENNTVTRNCNGVELPRQSGNPAVPVLNWNNIFDNDDDPDVGAGPYDCTCSASQPQFYCANYTTSLVGCGGTPPSTALNAEHNWWGTTDLAAIEATIHGYCVQSTPIDFVQYLDAPFDQGGAPVGGGNLIQGEVYDGMPNPPDPAVDWVVLGTATVPALQTFTIPDGKTLKFGEGAELVVEGELVVEDLTTADVVFTSFPLVGVPAAPGDWKGVVVQAGGTATIPDAIVEYATTAVKVTGSGSTLEVAGSSIKSFGSAGIRIENDAAAHIHDNRNVGSTLGIFASPGKDGIVVKDVDEVGVEVLIDNNEIKNGLAAIRIENAAPKMRGNLIKASQMGVYLGNSASPLISSQTDPTEIPGNEITGNCFGIYVNAPASQPTPEVTYNKIHTNTGCPGAITGNFNYFVGAYGPGSNLSLDAGYNWWGGNPSTVTTVAASVWDRSDAPPVPVLPVVNFLPFYTTSALSTLDPGSYLLGPLSSDPGDPDDMLEPGTYEVAGAVVVPSNAIWRIGPGVTINFGGNYKLNVDGDLKIAGSSGSGVTLQPAAGVPQWGGIIASGSNASLDIQFTAIADALTGIKVKDTVEPISIADSTIEGFSTGISLENVNPSGGAAQIARTTIDNGSTSGTGISVVDSTVVIADDNLIRALSVGILVAGNSLPTIGSLTSEANLIEDFFQFGILFTGVGAAGSIVNNHIENNPGTSPRQGTGILLDASSPAIRNNRIRYTDIGILVIGDSEPVIGEVSPSQEPHNTITSNRVGIRLEGTAEGAVSAQPTPTIQRNNLAGNDVADLEVVDYPAGIDLVINARENWWGSTDPATIRGRIQLDASNPIAVDFSNFLQAIDGMAPATAPNQFSTVITQVAGSAPTFTPTLPTGNTVQITAEILGTGTDVTLDIYEEDDDARSTLIHSETKANASGPQTFVWDGRRNQGAAAGQFVDNEAYIYVLSAAGGLGSYDPPRVDTPASAHRVGSSTDPYNVFENDQMKVVFNMDNAPGRTSLQLRESSSGPLIRTLATDVPFPRRDNQYFVYAGRNETQGYVLESHAEGSRYFFVTVPKDLRPNHVIVEQARPRTQPPDYDPGAPVPRIEVKSDPYLVINSYDQVSTIAYRLDQSANVMMQILDAAMNPVGDPLVSGISQSPGTTYTVTWSGVDALTAGGLYNLMDGNYTFAITAVNPSQPSLSTTYRGVIQVRQ
jgi:hypothetical protein